MLFDNDDANINKQYQVNCQGWTPADILCHLLVIVVTGEYQLEGQANFSANYSDQQLSR